MTASRIAMAMGLALALVAGSPASAQGAAGGPKDPPSAPGAADSGFAALKGAWLRPDGGYVIAIRSIAPNGEVDAMYYNPTILPFAGAQAVRDGATLRLSFRLQAGGYAGSTYELTFDPASDRLVGTYYQAVAKQKFDVYFVRK